MPPTTANLQFSRMKRANILVMFAVASVLAGCQKISDSESASTATKFHLEEATIADIQNAIVTKQITPKQYGLHAGRPARGVGNSRSSVERAYAAR